LWEYDEVDGIMDGELWPEAGVPGPAPTVPQVPHTSEDLKEAKRVRKEFPETWLWTEVLAGYLITLSCLSGFGLWSHM